MKRKANPTGHSAKRQKKTDKTTDPTDFLEIHIAANTVDGTTFDDITSVDGTTVNEAAVHGSTEHT